VRILYLASVWLHILAAMTWVGGMVTFVVAVMPYVRRQDEAARAAFLHWFGRRFRTVSWICFSILAATGAFNLSMRGVRIGDFVRPEWAATTFGQLVLVKLALVAVAAGLSALHERTAERSRARWLGRSLLMIGLLIVAVAVQLVRAI
jgi:uncharacterized membrane protein